MRRKAFVTIALAASLAAASPAGAVDSSQSRAYRDNPSVFGSVALSAGLSQILGRWAAIDWNFAPDCRNDPKCLDRVEALGQAVEKARASKDLRRALEAVNAAANRTIAYSPDPPGTDAWAAASETVAAGRGDCEDYAILKMSMLRQAGVPPEAMALAVVQVPGPEAFHALAIVSAPEGNLVLDIRNDRVARAEDVHGYLPLYSVSGGHAWLHGRKAGAPALVAAK